MPFTFRGEPLMYKAMISSFALLMDGAVSAVAQETAAPAAATTAVQEAPAPFNTGEIKLKPAIDVAVPSAEPQKAETPAAVASTPSPAEKPAAKRKVAAKQHP